MNEKMYIGAQKRYVILRNTFNNSPYYVRSLTEIANAQNSSTFVANCDTKMHFL